MLPDRGALLSREHPDQISKNNKSYMPKDNVRESERALVREAAVNRASRIKLRQELLSYVERATQEFMQSRNISNDRERELVEVGMKPFDRVFNIYIKNAGENMTQDEGHFYAYYIWHMRQEIVAFLESNP